MLRRVIEKDRAITDSETSSNRFEDASVTKDGSLDSTVSATTTIVEDLYYLNRYPDLASDPASVSFEYEWTLPGS